MGLLIQLAKAVIHCIDPEVSTRKGSAPLRKFSWISVLGSVFVFDLREHFIHNSTTAHTLPIKMLRSWTGKQDWLDLSNGQKTWSQFSHNTIGMIIRIVFYLQVLVRTERFVHTKWNKMFATPKIFETFISNIIFKYLKKKIVVKHSILGRRNSIFNISKVDLGVSSDSSAQLENKVWVEKGERQSWIVRMPVLW